MEDDGQSHLVVLGEWHKLIPDQHPRLGDKVILVRLWCFLPDGQLLERGLVVILWAGGEWSVRSPTFDPVPLRSSPTYPARRRERLPHTSDVDYYRVSGLLSVQERVLIGRTDGASAVEAAQADVESEGRVLVVEALSTLLAVDRLGRARG